MRANHLALPSRLVCSRLDSTVLAESDSIFATEMERNHFRCKYNQTVGYKKICC